MVEHVCSASNKEMESVGSGVQGQPEQPKDLSHKVGARGRGELLIKKEKQLFTK